MSCLAITGGILLPGDAHGPVSWLLVPSGRDGLDFSSLFELADEALYRAKASERNRVCTPDSSPLAPVA